MPQKDITVQNDFIQIDIPRYKNGAVAAQTASDANAGATYVLEVSLENKNSTPEWIGPCAMTDPTTGATVTSLVGPSKSGWAEVPGYSSVRLRRTDVAGNTGIAALEFREG